MPEETIEGVVETSSESQPEATVVVEATKPAVDLERQKEIERIAKSISDKSLATYQKKLEAEKQRADALERQLKGFESGLSELDSDTQNLLRGRSAAEKLAEYERREKEQVEREDAARKHNEFVANLRETIQELGVDPNDKRFSEAAKGAANQMDLQRRILKEAGLIVKENLKKADEANKARIVQERKDKGLDTPDLEGGSPIGKVSMAEIKEKLKNPMSLTKEQRKKYLDAMYSGKTV